MSSTTSSTRTSTSPLAAALEYTTGGAAVLPLHSPSSDGCSCRRPACASVGKHPRLLNGKDGASRELAQIRQWWRMWPTANVGLVPPDGLIVLDVDPRNAGDATLAKLLDRFGALPATRAARTGSNGVHIWLRHRGRARGSIGPGLDVKTSSGYVCAPPSRHVSGRRYEWIDTGRIARAPSWLARLLAPPPVVAGVRAGGRDASVDGLVRMVAEATPGCRNNRLFWAAARAHEDGLDTAPLLEAALRAGLPADEAEATIRSAGRAPERA